MKKLLFCLLAIPALAACVVDVVPEKQEPQKESSQPPPVATVSPPDKHDIAQTVYGPTLPADQQWVGGGTDPRADDGDPQGPYPQPWQPALSGDEPGNADSPDLSHH